MFAKGRLNFLKNWFEIFSKKKFQRSVNSDIVVSAIWGFDYLGWNFKGILDWEQTGTKLNGSIKIRKNELK